MPDQALAKGMDFHLNHGMSWSRLGLCHFCEHLSWIVRSIGHQPRWPVELVSIHHHFGGIGSGLWQRWRGRYPTSHGRGTRVPGRWGHRHGHWHAGNPHCRHRGHVMWWHVAGGCALRCWHMRNHWRWRQLLMRHHRRLICDLRGFILSLSSQWIGVAINTAMWALQGPMSVDLVHSQSLR